MKPLIVKSNFLVAHNKAQEEKLKIASIQYIINQGESFPELITPDRYICSGTVIAYPENEKRPVGKEISFYNFYNRFYTIFSVPEKLVAQNVGFLMDPGTYELEQESNVIKINPLAGLEFNTVLTWGNKGFNVLCSGSNEEIYELIQKIPLIQRAGKYVGPLFTGGLYSLKKVSNTPSITDKHHFLLIEPNKNVKKEEPAVLEEIITKELPTEELIPEPPKPEPVVEQNKMIFHVNASKELYQTRLKRARDVLGSINPAFGILCFLDALSKEEIIEDKGAGITLKICPMEYKRLEENARRDLELFEKGQYSERKYYFTLPIKKILDSISLIPLV